MAVKAPGSSGMPAGDKVSIHVSDTGLGLRRPLHNAAEPGREPSSLPPLGSRLRGNDDYPGVTWPPVYV